MIVDHGIDVRVRGTGVAHRLYISALVLAALWAIFPLTVMTRWDPPPARPPTPPGSVAAWNPSGELVFVRKRDFDDLSAQINGYRMATEADLQGYFVGERASYRSQLVFGIVFAALPLLTLFGLRRWLRWVRRGPPIAQQSGAG